MADTKRIGRGTKKTNKRTRYKHTQCKRRTSTHGRKTENSETQNPTIIALANTNNIKDKRLSHGHKSPLAAEDVGDVSRGFTNKTKRNINK